MKTEFERHGKPVSPSEVESLGWKVDASAGKAVFFSRALGSEVVRWSVPKKTMRANETLDLWIAGEATSLSTSRLNLEIGIGVRDLEGYELERYEPAAAGKGRKNWVATQALSEGGKPADAPEARLRIELRGKRPGDSAAVVVRLGWQAPDILLVYRYLYR